MSDSTVQDLAFIDLPNYKSAPYFGEYFGEWAMEPQAFNSQVQWMKQLNLTAHMNSDAVTRAESRGGRGEYQRTQSVALVQISGPMMKQVSSMSAGASTVQARQAIRAALRDDEISAIILQIDSPGGTVSGTKDLADEVASAAKKKPVYAYIEDLGASAAYWVAAQATKIYANETALVGSIGTYGVAYDASAAADKEGIKVHVIKAGSFKGAGVLGTPVTDDQIAMMQERIDDLNEHFVKSVSKGRSLSVAQVKRMADGAVHIAAKALELAMIDGIQSFEQTVAEAAAAAAKSSRSRNSGTSAMSTESTASKEPQSTAPAAATTTEIRKHCQGADDSFVLAQIEASNTLDEAKSAFIASQAEQIKTLQTQNAELTERQSAVVTPSKPGHRATNHVSVVTADASSSATDEWNDAVSSFMAKGLSRGAACSKANKAHPGLRQRMLAE